MDKKADIKIKTSFQSFEGYPYNYWNLQDISDRQKPDNLLSVAVDKRSGKIANVFWRLPILPQQQQNEQQLLQENMQWMQTAINHKAQMYDTKTVHGGNSDAVPKKKFDITRKQKPELGRTMATETLSLITGLLKEEGENRKLDYKSYLLLPPFEGNNKGEIEENDPKIPTVDDLIRQRKKDALQETKPQQLIFMPYCATEHAVVLAIDLNKYPAPNSIGCFDSSGHFNKLMFLNLNIRRFPRSIRSSLNPHRLNHRRTQFFKGNCTYHAEAFIKTSIKHLQAHPEISSLEEFEKVVNKGKFLSNILAEKDSIEYAPQAFNLNNDVINDIPHPAYDTEYNANRSHNRAPQFTSHKRKHHTPGRHQYDHLSTTKLISTTRSTSPIEANNKKIQHCTMQLHGDKAKQYNSDKSKKKSLNERKYNQAKIIESNTTPIIQKSSQSHNGSAIEPPKDKKHKSRQDLELI